MTTQEIDSVLSDGLPQVIEPGRRVLLIVPDTTRTAPVGDLVQRMVPMIQDIGARVDVIVALDEFTLYFFDDNVQIPAATVSLAYEQRHVPLDVLLTIPFDV